MNGHDQDTTWGIPGADRDPPPPPDGRAGAEFGRPGRDPRVEVHRGGLVPAGRADGCRATQLARRAATAVTDLPPVGNQVEMTCHRSGTPRPEGAEFAEPAAGPPRRRVLIGTSDDRLRSSGRDLLAEQGYLVVTEAGGVGCVALLRRLVTDVAVLDTELLWGGADGVLAHLRAAGDTRVPVVLLGSPVGELPGRAGGPVPPVVSVVEKPVRAGALLSAVRSATGACAATDPGASGRAGREYPRPPNSPGKGLPLRWRDPTRCGE